MPLTEGVACARMTVRASVRKNAPGSFGEEAIEAIIEAVKRDRANDSRGCRRDVVYHLLVMLAARDIHSPMFSQNNFAPRRQVRDRRKGVALGATVNSLANPQRGILLA